MLPALPTTVLTVLPRLGTARDALTGQCARWVLSAVLVRVGTVSFHVPQISAGIQAPASARTSPTRLAEGTVSRALTV